MARSRPGLFIALGILNILMGVLLLFCGVCGGLQAVSKAQLTINNRDVSQEFQDHMNSKVPAYTAFKIADVASRFLLALGFVAAGIGLWTVSRWGHILALLFAALAVFHQALVVLWQVVFIRPARAEFLKQFPFTPVDPGFIASIETIIVVGWAALILLYCLGLGIALVLPSTFRAVWSPPAEKNETEEDDEYDRPRRRRR
jgi:hypothetical protein